MYVMRMSTCIFRIIYWYIIMHGMNNIKSATKYVTRHVWVWRFSGRKINAAQSMNFKIKIRQQDWESSINGFRSCSYKFILTVSWKKWKKKSTELITTGSCLHPQFPNGIPEEKVQIESIHTNLNHINIQYTSNKKGSLWHVPFNFT